MATEAEKRGLGGVVVITANGAKFTPLCDLYPVDLRTNLIANMAKDGDTYLYMIDWIDPKIMHVVKTRRQMETRVPSPSSLAG